MPSSNWSEKNLLGQFPQDLSFLLKWVSLPKDSENNELPEVTKWLNLLNDLGKEELTEEFHLTSWNSTIFLK